MDTLLTEIIRSSVPIASRVWLVRRLALRAGIQLVPPRHRLEQLLLDGLNSCQRLGDGVGRRLVEIRRAHAILQPLLLGLELLDARGQRQQLLLFAVARLARGRGRRPWTFAGAALALVP